MVQSKDCFLFYNKFNLLNFKTWLAPIIRLFSWIYCKLSGKPYAPYTHCGLILPYENELWVYEANEKGFIRSMKAIEYFKKRGIDNFLLLRPRVQVQERSLCLEAEKACSLKLKYDYFGLLLEAVYLSTNERLWVGNNSINKRVFCTEIVGYLYNKSSSYTLFENPYSVHPMSFYNSTMFSKYRLDKGSL